jgi:mRNA-degrading endonuclease RelE of RelBE toxin-antitoxin system
MNFSETPEFRKDFKKLSKKYLSLTEDLNEFKKVVKSFPSGKGNNSAILFEFPKLKIVKARFFCKYLKGSSLRIIYAYHEETNKIELIEFIELYYKGNKEREDKIRIQNYIKPTP